MKLPENFKIPQTTWFCNTAIPQLKINISAKLHHPKPLRIPSWTSLLLKSSLLKSTGKVLAQEQPLQKRQGMQTSVVVILFVCLFLNWLSIFFPLLYFYWCVFTGIYLSFGFCFVLFCFVFAHLNPWQLLTMSKLFIYTKVFTSLHSHWAEII